MLTMQGEKLTKKFLKGTNNHPYFIKNSKNVLTFTALRDIMRKHVNDCVEVECGYTPLKKAMEGTSMEYVEA